MSDSPFHDLLNAAIRHLEDLREHGVKYIQASPQVLSELSQPISLRPAHAVASARPGPAISPVPRAPAPATVVHASALPRAAGSATGTSAPKAATPATAASGDSASAGQKRVLSREEKERAIAELHQRALACRKCEHLAVARRNVVFGVGDIHSPLMFVGEAPGADEDAQGEPFVGKAGQLLTKIIQTMGLSRETVYIANILKCRPDTPGQSAGNRKPTPAEMATCLPFLLEQIDLIQPRVIVALGATAIEGLFGKTEGITRLRGKWMAFRDTPVMPTYHPAYLLRNQALTEKRKVWEDMLAALEKLELPISEKQRGYFLKA